MSMTTGEGDLTPPEKRAVDYGHALVKATVSGVPVVGSPIAELFGAIVPASLERRRDLWMAKVAEAIDELRNRPDVDLDDERFVTLLIEASKIALGTHLEAKLDTLKNCLISAALPEERDDFLAMRFLRFVEELSPEHLVVLHYLSDPTEWYNAHSIERPHIMAGSPKSILDGANIGVETGVLDLCLRDLGDRGLANVGSMGTMMTENGVWQRLTTELGTQFLRFVRLM